MSSWGNNDNAANAPYWAVNSAIAPANPNRAAPTAANVALLYANTTANVYTSRETIGLFGLDSQEISVLGDTGAHTGWVLKTEGQGGRAGRVQYETLVALSTMNSDGDAQLFPNVEIILAVTSSASVVSNTLYANSASLVVTPTLVGNTAATLTYQWQVNNAAGSLGWTNVVNGTPANTNYTGGTSATLLVKPADTTANNYKYRVTVTAADQGVSATSANSTVLVS
ncbi:MAG: hypothetical protein EBU90_10175 [Proteobacteria bacterium]|nr:hypothetical protein [Pseudomonadota bacterium]